MEYGVDKGTKVRMLIVLGLFAICAAGVIARAAQIQIVQAGVLKELAQRQHLHTVEVEAKRGDIVDAQGEPLAVSREQAQVYARPEHLSDREDAAAALAPILGIDRKGLLKKLHGKSSFVWLARTVTLEQAKQVDELGLDGVGTLPASRRFYPGGESAAHVLGFTRLDGKGLEGLEYHYNDMLTGDPIKVILERDARGGAIFLSDQVGRIDRLGDEVLGGSIFHNATRGASLRLTILRQLQYVAERELEKGIRESGAKAGCVVAMDPDDGRVLAMASWPSFDPNRFSAYSQNHFRNRCVTMAFEPGSTFKAFTVAAAIEDGVIRPKEKFYCEEGSYVIGGATIGDIKPHGWLGVDEILMYSSNIGAAKIGEKMGKERMHRACRAFGFGEKTGIDFPGESIGLLRPHQNWSQVAVGTIAFGQGIAATPIQLVTALSTIANGGVAPKPLIVESAAPAGGEERPINRPVRQGRVITPRTAKIVTEYLKRVVSEKGTGRNAMVPGYTVAGKTGTAQKAKEKSRGYADGKYVASFMGFLPADRPRLAMIVVIDEPDSKRPYGGLTAAPVFQAIAKQAMVLLKVPSEDQPAEIASMDPGLTPAQAESALARIKKRKDLREGDWSAPAGANTDGEMVAPDLRGLTLRQALRALSGKAVGVEIHGSGVVVAMDPAPGEKIEEMGVVRLQLEAAP